MPHARSRATHRSKSARRLAAIAMVSMLAAYAPAGTAAKVYRCGNVFQDLPCPEIKAPEARPIERPAAARDATPCGGVAREAAGRSDCVARASTRDVQPSSVIESKR